VVPDSAIPYTAACRGVSYYAVPDAGAGAVCSTRIIFGTLDARPFAIDARTGKPCEDFGTHGQVDTKIGMGDTPDGYVSITSPPTIVRGVVVTGHQVLTDRTAGRRPVSSAGSMPPPASCAGHGT
jgi:quinoprotein glucose dehydrogenase